MPAKQNSHQLSTLLFRILPCGHHESLLTPHLQRGMRSRLPEYCYTLHMVKRQNHLIKLKIRNNSVKTTFEFYSSDFKSQEIILTRNIWEKLRLLVCMCVLFSFFLQSVSLLAVKNCPLLDPSGAVHCWAGRLQQMHSALFNSIHHHILTFQYSFCIP